MDVTELTEAQLKELEEKIVQRKRQLRAGTRRLPRLRTKREKLQAQLHELDEQIKQAETGAGAVVRRRRRATGKRRRVAAAKAE